MTAQPLAQVASSVAAGLLALVGVVSASDPAVTHERSSGVAVVGGGFIAVTAVWVTPGLTVHPHYATRWVSDPARRARHREVATARTLFLIEVANQSALRLEGYLALNARLRVNAREHAPDPDPAVRARLPDLWPGPVLQRVPPHTTVLTAAAFPAVPPGTGPVILLIPPLWIFRGSRQIGETPAFELGFDPRGLTYPP
ncbi:MAG: hypothetical protein QN146_10825 [Armatimonadota bacterium]|nr:hypothetical protein [Armatimonadota bacterium]